MVFCIRIYLKAWCNRGKGNKTIVGYDTIEQRFACFNDNEKMLNKSIIKHGMIYTIFIPAKTVT